MKKRKNSLVLKFLIPYIISMFAICIMVYILYFPQYEKRFLKAEESNINKKIVLNFCFKIPNIEEQEKIGEYLSLLDKEIDNLKKQKELIKEMKRGAMQKLLSGEVRLLE